MVTTLTIATYTSDWFYQKGLPCNCFTNLFLNLKKLYANSFSVLHPHCIRHVCWFYGRQTNFHIRRIIQGKLIVLENVANPTRVTSHYKTPNIRVGKNHIHFNNQDLILNTDLLSVMYSNFPRYNQYLSVCESAHVSRNLVIFHERFCYSDQCQLSMPFTAGNFP